MIKKSIKYIISVHGNFIKITHLANSLLPKAISSNAFLMMLLYLCFEITWAVFSQSQLLNFKQ